MDRSHSSDGDEFDDASVVCVDGLAVAPARGLNAIEAAIAFLRGIIERDRKISGVVMFELLEGEHLPSRYTNEHLKHDRITVRRTPHGVALLRAVAAFAKDYDDRSKRMKLSLRRYTSRAPKVKEAA